MRLLIGLGIDCTGLRLEARIKHSLKLRPYITVSGVKPSFVFNNTNFLKLKFIDAVHNIPNIFLRGFVLTFSAHH